MDNKSGLRTDHCSNSADDCSNNSLGMRATLSCWRMRSCLWTLGMTMGRTPFLHIPTTNHHRLAKMPNVHTTCSRAAANPSFAELGLDHRQYRSKIGFRLSIQLYSNLNSNWDDQDTNHGFLLLLWMGYKEIRWEERHTGSPSITARLMVVCTGIGIQHACSHSLERRETGENLFHFIFTTNF